MNGNGKRWDLHKYDKGELKRGKRYVLDHSAWGTIQCHVQTPQCMLLSDNLIIAFIVVCSSEYPELGVCY